VWDHKSLLLPVVRQRLLGVERNFANARGNAAKDEPEKRA